EPQPDPGREGSGGVMQDLGYLFDSMPILAAQTEQAFRAQQRALGRQLDNACVSGAEGQQCLRVTGELSKVTDAPTELDSQVAPQLSLAYGYGLTDQLTAGVTASMFGSSLDNQLLTERGGAELDSGVGVGSYLHFSQGADETGVQACVSLGYGEQRGEFVRGDGLANVQHGKGKADVKSVAVRGSLGYGVEVADWKVTPHAEVTHFITSRDGYREGGERLVFDVEHDKVKDKSTVGKVGVKGETALAKGVKLKLDTGVEMDLDVNPVTLKGRSDIFSLGEGMQEFAVSAELERNDMRPYAAVGVGYELEQAGTVGLNVKASQAEYGNQGVDGSVQLSYELKF
ncbi:MAG: autotransporter outer membrane beta-barrel domain-containing protein, partial [Aeromonadaceae bacterium]